MGICSICSGGESKDNDKYYEIIRENKKEIKNDSNLSSEIKSNNEISKSKHILNDQILQKILDDNPSIEKRIIIIQSMMKKYKLRNIYLNLRNKVRKNEEYFSYKEAFETLTKNLLSDLSISNYEYKYRNGSVYNGNWLGGFRHGKGKMIWSDGTFYEGDWFYGHAEGDGCLYFNNGSYLKGDFRYNKLNGKGESFQSDLNYKYEGEFMNNEQNGEGIENWNDDSSEYVGLFYKGQKEIFGKYFWNDGSYYIGEWKNNKINGYVSIFLLILFIYICLYTIYNLYNKNKGIYYWSDGRKYIGEWSNSKMKGFGIFYWKDQKTYIGHYNDDEKSDFGIYIKLNKRKYEGYWNKGIQDSLGRNINLENENSQIGIWKENSLIEQYINETEEYIKGINQINEKVFEIEEKKDKLIQKIKEIFNKYLPNTDITEYLSTGWMND